MTRLRGISAACAAILFALPVDTVLANDDTRDTIVVTATRNPTSIDDTIVPVRLISRDDIELSLASDLADLLRFEAGLDIGRNGGPGQATSVFLRGTESNHTLVLMDGVRINPGTIGGAAFQNIAPDLIERVEIVKGARSSLFGTDAIGGVINIITRKADGNYLDAGLSTGSFDTRSGHVSAGARRENAGLGATVSFQETDGFPPRTDSDIDRGYKNLSASVQAATTFGRNTLSARHWQTGGTTEYLDFFLNPVDQDYENSATAVQLDSGLGDNGTSQLILSHMRDEIAQNQSPDFVESKRLTLDWQYSHALDQHTLSGGVYLVDEDASAESFGAGFDESTDVRAVFVQDEMSFERQRAFVAVRLTDHETFGQQTTWNAEYAFDLNDSWTVGAGLAHAFRAPDATDRFGFGGNPALDPELSDSASLSLRYSGGSRHRFEIEYYANDIEDLIEFDFATFTLANLDRAEIRGVQAGYEYRGDSITVRADLVRQSADNATTGERLLRRAEESATVSVVKNLGPHRVGLSVLAAGDRKDFGDVTLDSYVVANLNGQLVLGDHWRLTARIENLFDEAYETAANFRMQELSAFVELSYGSR